jgi:phosphomannomutase
MDVIEQAQAWLAQDPDPQTRAELQQFIDTNDDELADCFAGRLQFGTAGLRGKLGPGPNRMNRVVVMQAAAGLAAYLNQQHPHKASILIGYDARHNSDVFAADTAAIMQGAGITALVLPMPLPTPVLAYAIKHLGASAGVMVTASHNPPQDNGYKVYLGDGCQIVPPTDADIAQEIERVANSMSVQDIPTDNEWVTLGDDVLEDYIARATAPITD